MFLLNKVIPSSEGHQVSIISRGRYGDRAGTPDVCMTQLVGEALQLVAVKVVVIPQNMVVAGSTGALQNKTDYLFFWLSGE